MLRNGSRVCACSDPCQENALALSTSAPPPTHKPWSATPSPLILTRHTAFIYFNTPQCQNGWNIIQQSSPHRSGFFALHPSSAGMEHKLKDNLTSNHSSSSSLQSPNTWSLPKGLAWILTPVKILMEWHQINNKRRRWKITFELPLLLFGVLHSNYVEMFMTGKT